MQRENIRRSLLYLAGMVAVYQTALMAQSQTTSIVAGTTMPVVAAGAPAGSYALSGFDTVNLFNGHLDIAVPLLRVGGRGEAGYTMVLPVQRSWQMMKTISGFDGSYSFFPQTGQSSASHWWADNPAPLYSPGILVGREVFSGSQEICPNVAFATLKRLTFISADGTEIELVDQQTGGVAETPQCNNGYSRGTVFVARDGSGATFVADSPIVDFQAILSDPNVSPGSAGVLIFRNGVRYRTNAYGTVDWIRDRNGNQINFYYDGFHELIQVVDSLNRVINITHNTSSDQIVFPGTGGVSRTIQINYSNTSTVLDPTYAPIKSYGQLFGFGSYSTNADLQVVQSIVLPDGRQYSFLYNDYSEPVQVVLPTGGKIRYTHAGFDGSQTGVVFNGGNYYIYRRAMTRDVYPDGANKEQHAVYTPTYSTGYIQLDPQHNMPYWFTTVTVDHYDNANNPLAHDKHYFYGGPNNPYLYPYDIPYQFWLDGKEYQTDELSANGSSVLRSTVRQWQQRVCGPSEHCLSSGPVYYSNGNGSLSPTDPRLTQETTTLPDANQVALQNYSYDQYNNKTDTYEYDFGYGAAGGLLRHTHDSFLTSGYDYNAGTHLPSLLSENTVYSGAGSLLADTLYYYDQTGLTPRSNLSGYTDPNNGQRGNPTSVYRWLNTTGGYTVTQAAYDIAGSVTSSTDANGHATTFSYNDSFSTSNTLNGFNSFAFITQATNPLNQTISTSYDYYLGRPTNATDPNFIQMTISYEGASNQLDRPKQVVRGLGTIAQTQTLFSYCDFGCNSVTTQSDLNSAGDGLITSVVLYDASGRQIESRQYEASGYISQKKGYDGMGRVANVSNPYRPASEQLRWTTYGYDGLGRQTSVTASDGLSTTYTSYLGNQTTMTDPTGVTSSTLTDAAGRVTQVTEAGTYFTYYTFDALDRLTYVNQSGRARSFTYDSLGRLTSAQNPESGTVNYTSYDNNGNLLSKTVVGGPTTNTTYDWLNRVQTKSYSDGTPQANYAYDTIFKGALSSVTSSVSATSHDSYDALGRVTHSTQTTNSSSYPFSYAYNRAGALTSETYPSGRVVTNSYDVAGRVTAVTGLSGSIATNYANGIQYASHGPISQMYLNNNRLLELRGYSADRQQLTSVSAGALSLGYFYCPNGASLCNTNNGNVLRQTIGGLIQDYGYTEANGLKLNRLASATETGGSNEWFQNYGHDAYANHWVSGGLVLSAFTPTASTNFDTNNRLQIQNTQYDTAGNQKQIGGFTFGYDAENHQSSSTINSSTTTYRSDGDGRRVMKLSGGTTVYVYDAMGELAAEYATNASPALCQTCYLTADALGSTRLVTNENAVAVACHDYLPFGEEIPSGLGGRSGCYTASDGITEKFTGKERDAETGLDYFEARYMSSAQGRFTSPDPAGLLAAKPANPQSWNLYSYVMNNPLIYIDPNGLDCVNATNNTGGFTVNHDTNTGDCGKSGGTWVPGYVDESWVRYNAKTGQYQVASIDAAGSYAGSGIFDSTIDYATFKAGAKTDENGKCLSGCKGYGFSSASTDLLESQLVGKSDLGGYLHFLSDRTRPLTGGVFSQIAFGGLAFWRNHWAGPGGFGPPGSRSDWAASVHDFNFSTNGPITIRSYWNPTLSPATANALIQSNSQLIRNARGVEGAKMGLFFGAVNAFQFYVQSWK